jgi:hypothetical protein
MGVEEEDDGRRMTLNSWNSPLNLVVSINLEQRGTLPSVNPVGEPSHYDDGVVVVVEGVVAQDLSLLYRLCRLLFGIATHGRILGLLFLGGVSYR